MDFNKYYELLVEYFNFSKEDLMKFNLNAIDAAFISDEEKETLKDIIKNAYER